MIPDITSEEIKNDINMSSHNANINSLVEADDMLSRRSSQSKRSSKSGSSRRSRLSSKSKTKSKSGNSSCNTTVASSVNSLYDYESLSPRFNERYKAIMENREDNGSNLREFDFVEYGGLIDVTDVNAAAGDYDNVDKLTADATNKDMNLRNNIVDRVAKVSKNRTINKVKAEDYGEGLDVGADDQPNGSSLPDPICNLYDLWNTAVERKDNVELDLIRPVYSKAILFYLEQCQRMHSGNHPKSIYRHVKGMDFLRKNQESVPMDLNLDLNESYRQVLTTYLKSVDKFLDYQNPM